MRTLTTQQKLNNQEFLQEGCLPPRVTVVPALHKNVFYKNKEESEMLQILNGTFRFSYQQEDCLEDFANADYDDSAWDTIDVPSMWQYRGYSKPLYPNVEYPIPFNPPYVCCDNPVGYYRRKFTAKRSGRSILYFGGVDNAYFVYLNGTYVGFSKGSRLPAEYDVTELLQDGENLLCVKVFTYSDATYLENQDMLLANGIFRDVILIQTGEVSLWDYELYTEENTLHAEVTLSSFLSLYDGCALRLEIAGQTFEQPAAHKLHFSATIPNAKLWNAETPHLYTVYLTLLKDGEALEVHSKKIGFRHARTEGNRLLLNETPITLKGICRHEHDPKNGRAITVDLIEKELRLIKDHNFNAIRCAHYPNNPAFYEIASELGIYVMNENDLETHGAHVTGDQGFLSKQPEWLSAYRNRAIRYAERDKNETCVIIWSAGNEHGYGENVDETLRYIKKRLRGVPIFHTMDDGKNPTICDFRANGYFSMDSLTSYPADGKPVILTEYGHAMGNSPGLMEDTWDYVYQNRHIIGGYLWEFKNHGFYQEDEKGRAFYQYGGDFEDINHWSNFSMDGYCLSDGTPKPSLRDSKNVLSPCYVTFSDGQIRLLNTNDFRSLEYVKMHWEICEDYHVLEKGDMQLPAIESYHEYTLPISTDLPGQTPGASYYVNLHFYEESPNGTTRELAVKQVCLGSVPKVCLRSVLKASLEERIRTTTPCTKPATANFNPEQEIPEDCCQSDPEIPDNLGQFAHVQINVTDATVQGPYFSVKLINGLLSYYEKDGKVLLDAPMKLNFYRAPIDNDGIVGWSLRWIQDWDKVFLKHFTFFPESVELEKDAVHDMMPNATEESQVSTATKLIAADANRSPAIRIKVTGKALPTARYAGFFVTLKYHIYEDGLIVVEYEGEPYGKLPKVLPRIGICFEVNDTYTHAKWYGRGPEENYCDRRAHCPVGLYQLPVSEMNFRYDVPQECGTRTDTRFVTLSGAEAGLSVIGMDTFSFSCHDFTLNDLEAARHRNKLEKADRKYLYIDYKMRGLGSHSCGPNPEECYELHPHHFRFAFAICGKQDENALLQLARTDFGVHTEALSEGYTFDTRWKPAGVIECDINRD